MKQAETTPWHSTIHPKPSASKIRRNQKRSALFFVEVMAEPSAGMIHRRGRQVRGCESSDLDHSPSSKPLSTWPGRPPGSGPRPAWDNRRHRGARRRPRRISEGVWGTAISGWRCASVRSGRAEWRWPSSAGRGCRYGGEEVSQQGQSHGTFKLGGRGIAAKGQRPRRAWAARLLTMFSWRGSRRQQQPFGPLTGVPSAGQRQGRRQLGAALRRARRGHSLRAAHTMAARGEPRFSSGSLGSSQTSLARARTAGAGLRTRQRRTAGRVKLQRQGWRQLGAALSCAWRGHFLRAAHAVATRGRASQDLAAAARGCCQTRFAWALSALIRACAGLARQDSAAAAWAALKRAWRGHSLREPAHAAVAHGWEGQASAAWMAAGAALRRAWRGHSLREPAHAAAAHGWEGQAGPSFSGREGGSSGLLSVGACARGRLVEPSFRALTGARARAAAAAVRGSKR